MVNPGKPLYGIAWRYGRDSSELGNRKIGFLRAPWTFLPGQMLRLTSVAEAPATALQELGLSAAQRQ